MLLPLLGVHFLERTSWRFCERVCNLLIPLNYSTKDCDRTFSPQNVGVQIAPQLTELSRGGESHHLDDQQRVIFVRNNCQNAANGRE